MNNKRTHAERRFNRPQPVARLVDRVMSKSMRQNGFAHSEVLTRWSAIVGSKLAADSCPEKLAFAPHNQGAGVLHLRVSGGAALEFQHREPQIIERINSYFGFRAVHEIRLVQAALPKPVMDQNQKKAAGKPNRRQPAPGRLTRGVNSEDLRAALDRLGDSIESDS